MKKVLFLILVLGFVACSKQKEGYEIEVKIEGAEGNILLERRGPSSWIPVDTAQITDGTAILKGAVEVPEDYYLSVMGQPPKAIVFVENTKMGVKGNIDSFDNLVVTGSDTHDEYDSVNNEVRRIGEKYMSLYQQAREAGASGDNAKSQELLEQVRVLYDSTNIAQVNFIRNNPSSYVNPYLLARVQHNIELEELDNLVGSLDPKLGMLPSVTAIKERIEKLKSLEVGRIAPDFTMNDPDGNPVTFSDIYSQNELTLIDFWAAWCGPCRRENPNIVAVFNKYKDSGFTVFGVSLDRDRQAWLKAIEDDKLTWTHVSDLGYWNNAAARLYAVNSIPASLIIDRNGVIKAKDKRGEELGKTIEELLK